MDEEILLDKEILLEQQVQATNSKDYFSTGISDIKDFKLPQSLYHYYIDDVLMNKPPYTKILIPPTDAVQSVVYAPYLERATLDFITVDYDYTRFPIKGLSDSGSGTDIEFIAKGTELQRINGQIYQFINKKLGNFNPYKISGKNIGGPRSWKNEGKLWQFPYHYALLFDGISDPLEVRPHLCYSKSDAEVWVKTPLTAGGAYTLYVKQYKEDTDGLFEGVTSTASLQLPIISSAYTDYMSRNKNQLNQQRNQNLSKLALTGAVAIGAGVAATALAPTTAGGSLVVYGSMAAASKGVAAAKTASTISKGAGLLAGSSAVGAASGVFSSMATERDLASSPGNLQSFGNDLMFDLQNNLAIGRNSLNLYRMKTVEEYLIKIGDYFAMYGYKQNKILRPNIRNRHYYNYIRTSGVNLTNKDGSAIPKEDFMKLKAIYEKGVTVWHIDRAGVNVGDYSMDNYEV